jgi:DNA-binding response OmpR family regulator
MCQRILWIEDDYRDLEFMILPLKRRGYQFDVADNYLKAIDHINNGYYNLILLDLIIPEGIKQSQMRPENYEPNGFKILKFMKECNNVTPIIVFSVVEDDQMISYLFELGVRKYLKKGATLPEILEYEVMKILIPETINISNIE